jgi:hypothetical protein
MSTSRTACFGRQASRPICIVPGVYDRLLMQSKTNFAGGGATWGPVRGAFKTMYSNPRWWRNRWRAHTALSSRTALKNITCHECPR